MRGIVHFMSGLAVVSCFPAAVTAAAGGIPLYFLLGVFASLLPDMLDSRILRFFWRYDAGIVPDLLDPDPQMIANAVAEAIDRASEWRKPFRLRLHPIPLPCHHRMQYRLRFDPACRQVTVSILNTRECDRISVSGTAVTTHSDAAVFEPNVQLDYTAAIEANGSDGFDIEMTPNRHGVVTPVYMPWLRQSSHSVTAGILLAAAATLVWGPLAGIVIFCSYVIHLLLDQAGAMGCNLAWPYSARRTPGLKMPGLSGASVTFTVIWISALLIYINLVNAIGTAHSPIPNPLRLLLFAGAFPLMIMTWMQRRRV